MIFRIMITLVIVLLAGCAPATIQGLRENPAGILVFEADEDYQIVYRKILTPARNCWQGGLVTGQVIVQGDLFTDTRRGNITVALHSGVGVDTYFTMDILAMANHGTRVTVYYAFRNQKRNAAAIELWVKQNATDCRGPEIPLKE